MKNKEDKLIYIVINQSGDYNFSVDRYQARLINANLIVCIRTLRFIIWV